MRLSIRILGSEVFGIDTTPYDEPATNDGSVTTTAFGFEPGWHDKHHEYEESP